MTLKTGAQLGPYEILALLGAGGMGEVYRARDTRLGREVAVKVLPSAFAADTDRLRRFEQEARATAAPTSCRNCSKARRCASVWAARRCRCARRSITHSRSRAGWRRRTS